MQILNIFVGMYLHEGYHSSPAKLNKFADELHTTWRIWKDMEDKGTLPKASAEPTPQGSDEGMQQAGSTTKLFLVIFTDVVSSLGFL